MDERERVDDRPWAAGRTSSAQHTTSAAHNVSSCASRAVRAMFALGNAPWWRDISISQFIVYYETQEGVIASLVAAKTCWRGTRRGRRCTPASCAIGARGVRGGRFVSVEWGMVVVGWRVLAEPIG